MKGSTLNSTTTPANPAAALAAGSGFTRIRNYATKNPRAAHRQAQHARVDGSGKLTDKFPQLKALTLNLEFMEREGAAKANGMKYSANLEHAKSVLLFACPSPECVGGDFDLTEQLARAAKGRQSQVSGEIRCQGKRKQVSGEVVPCRSLLRYKLTLGYHKK